MTTKVVHVNSQEWKDTPEDQRVYIGRAVPRRGFKASIFANPFKIEVGKMTREEAIDEYAWKCWQDIMADAPVNIESVLSLKDKILGCWCAPEDCHGDVLAWICDCPPEAYERWIKAAGDVSMLDCWDRNAT